MLLKAECKMNGRGAGGGAGGFGSQQSNKIQLVGEVVFWNCSVKGTWLEQARQAGASGRRYVLRVKGARVCVEATK